MNNWNKCGNLLMFDNIVALIVGTVRKTARISPNRGVLSVKDHELPDYVLNRLREGANTLTESRNKISDKQASVISNRVSNVPPEKLVKSPITKAILTNDV